MKNLLIQIYEQKKAKYGEHTYKYISEIFELAKIEHKKSFEKTDHEQSWRSYKGKNFETLIEHIIKDEINKFGLEVINGNSFERKNDANLSEKLALLKRKLLIDYGDYGYHLPDVDIVIYCPEKITIIAVISIKVTLRERIAQTGYWKLKMQNQPLTEHIKFYFITPDSDGTLKKKKPAKKGRAIIEIDMDGSYVLDEVEESDKVKNFDKFIKDLRKLKNNL